MTDVDEATEVREAIDPSVDKDTRMWSMSLHFSILAMFMIPIAGIIAPIIIWQIKKDDYPVIDLHGKNAVNWIISYAIYSIISVILAFVLIGFVLLVALLICSVVLPVIAGVKANNGVVWKYPLTYEFLK